MISQIFSILLHPYLYSTEMQAYSLSIFFPFVCPTVRSHNKMNNIFMKAAINI